MTTAMKLQSTARTQVCVRAGCTNKMYSFRSGGYCHSHAKIFALDTVGPYVAHDDVARFLWPQIRRGYHLVSMFTTVGLSKGTATQFERGCAMQSTTFDRLRDLDVEQCRRIPAYRARRRLQSLRAAGMRVADLETPGLSYSTISRLCSASTAPQFVEQDVHREVMQLWDEHADGQVTEPVRWMARWGWATPWAWEDIDDPDEKHGTMGRVHLTAYAERFYARHLRPYGGLSGQGCGRA